MDKNLQSTIEGLFQSTVDNSSASPVKKRASRKAFEIMLQPGNERTAVFQHSVLCQTFLPYKNLGDDVREIERRQGRAILSLEAGKIYNPYTQNLDKVGLPYGAQARLILSYINTQAVKSQSPVIDVEDSMTAFIKRIGLSTDGMTIKRAKEQLKRLSGTRMSIGFLVDEENKRGIQTNLNLIQSFDIWLPEDEGQKILWTSTVRLSDDYFNSLVNHAIPLDERALAALSNNALALDIYSWLSQRLHRIQKGSPDFVPWQALKEQFGEGYGEMFKFKQKFRQTLQIVQNQYKDAKLEEDKNKGFLLYNSPTPIPKQQIIIPQIGNIK